MDGTSTARLKVLVVDDECPIADSLASILDLQGYDAMTAYSGMEAVETARQFRPDLIISDVMMQGLNGIEAAILIRSFLPGCKILLISGNATTLDLLEGARERGHEFDLLSKPIHPTDLLAILSN